MGDISCDQTSSLSSAISSNNGKKKTLQQPKLSLGLLAMLYAVTCRWSQKKEKFIVGELINPGQRLQVRWPQHHHPHHLELVLQIGHSSHQVVSGHRQEHDKCLVRNEKTLHGLSILRASHHQSRPCYPRHQSQPCPRLPSHRLPHPEIDVQFRSFINRIGNKMVQEE